MTGKRYTATTVTCSSWLPGFRRKTGIPAEGTLRDEVKKLCLGGRYLPATSGIQERGERIHPLFQSALQRINLVASMASDSAFMYDGSKEKIVAGVKNGSKNGCNMFPRNTQVPDGKVASLPDQSAKPLFADWPDHHDRQAIASALDGDGTHA